MCENYRVLGAGSERLTPSLGAGQNENLSSGHDVYEISQAKSPTERLREMQRSRDWRLASPSSEPVNPKLNIPPLDPVSEKSVRTLKKLGELKLGSDSCYSRSDNSSDSECPTTRQALSLGNKPPTRGEVRFMQPLAGDAEQMSSAKLDRLCPRVRNPPHQNRHTHYDSTSLSSVDTSSSSDLWNVRAMPDVPFTRLNKPISLRANPQVRHRPSHLDSLTDEVLVKILSYISSKELMGVARVCRRFYFLAWEPELWERISFNEDTLDVDRALKTTFQLVSRNGVSLVNTVRTISLSGCSRLTDRGLAIIARRCHILQELEIQFCPNVTNGGLLDLTSRCKQLNHLDVSGCPMVSAVNVASGTSENKHLGIQYLDLSDCPHVDDTSLRLVVESCPQLQYLYLRRCHQISDHALRSISSYCLMLRELSVSDCPLVSDQGLAELGRLGPSLRYLSVAKCDKITDSGVRTLARHCYRLRYLNMRGCEQVSDSAVEWLSRSCTRLRSLDIGKCDVSDLGLKLLSCNCPNLKKLSVKSCTLVTDTGVESVSYCCRGLQHLNIQDVAGVTIQGYRAVKNNCRKCIIEHTNPGFH
eukprot:TRINITY_DN10168_c0_g1_i1.p1 TRINITY_DN10168_c0_g1~~TRINITY_DN10168_c0_g1_i1.p1  ORF type:complete len:587 (-),score=71.91 TRINITY_DN10168_c0_g1_i1:825-2585(-)